MATRDPDARLHLLTTCWDERGIELATLQTDRNGTVVPTRPDSRPDASLQMKTLPALLGPSSAGTEAQFELGPLLGEGGMGIVRVAKQTALEREVAVKGLREGVDPHQASPHLLHEARVTGAIEHPNVVPIYALGRNEQDQPLIVMKRIEGSAWQEELTGIRTDPSFGLDEYLTRHLGILLRVAHAIHFAHRRGVLHRDLKPENVMIGSFGEVYVVDWGIAVGLPHCELSGLPAAVDEQQVAGTPCYMAPEMAAGMGEAIDERTDVYLLGGILHQILTGEPPHTGETLEQILAAAFQSEPRSYGPAVPSGLVEICHRAMQAMPHERYPDAAAFAAAVERVLTHRSSMVLSEEAQGRLGALREGLDEVDPEDERQIQKLYGLFSECRFAFSHALRTWDDNRVAREGLQQVLELMIDFELEHGSAGAAATMVADLPEPRPELAARVEAARRDEKEAEARLAALQHDADLTIGASLRAVLALILSLTWSTLCVGCGLLTRYDVYAVGHLQFAAINAVFVCVLLAALLLSRRALRANVANRRLSVTVMLVFCCYTALWPLAGWLGVSVNGTAALHMLMGTTLWLVATVNIDRGWWPMTVGLGSCLVLALLLPTYGFELLGLGGGGGAVVAAVGHWRHRNAVRP